MEITITSDKRKNDEVVRMLKEIPHWSELTYQRKKSNALFRGIEPTVLVALCTAASISFSYLIRSLVEYLKRPIKIQIGDIIIEIPANCPKNKVDEILSQIKEIKSPKIIINENIH